MAKALAEMEKKDLFRGGYNTAYYEIIADMEIMVKEIENDPLKEAYKHAKLNVEVCSAEKLSHLKKIFEKCMVTADSTHLHIPIHWIETYRNT
ncbi:MAG: hypothetical protein QXP59_02285 [Saccharolobus sp.]